MSAHSISQARRSTDRHRPDVPPSPRCGRALRVLRGDRGSVSVGVALTVPVVWLLAVTIAQFALWSHATDIAQAAAAQGLAVARAQHGTAGQGAAAARRMLDEFAHGPLTDTQVQAHCDATTATVQIRGQTTVLVLPFLRLPVHAEATGPRELFLPDTGGAVAAGRPPGVGR